MQLLRLRCGLGKCGPAVANTDPLWPRATRGEAPHPGVLRWSPLCWGRTCCARWRRPPAAVSPRPASFGPAASDLCPVCGAPSTEPGRVTSADAGARPLRTLRDRQATGRARCPVPRRRASRSGLAACPEGVQASAHTAALCSRTTLPRELRAARRTRSPRCRRPCRSSPAASCSGGSTPGPPTPPRSVLARGRPSRRCPVRHEPPRASCPPRSNARSAARRGHGAVLACGRHPCLRAGRCRGGPRARACPPRSRPPRLAEGVSRLGGGGRSATCQCRCSKASRCSL